MKAVYPTLAAFAISAFSAMPAYGQRYTPVVLCGTTENNTFESITAPIAFGGDYPSGSVQAVTIVVGDTKSPGGGQASTGDTEHVIITLDTDNDGVLEPFGNLACTYNRAAVPAGCTVTQNIVIPNVTEDTTFRGRATLSYNNLVPANGCGGNSYGDHEDFVIVADVAETLTIADVTQAEDGGPITVSVVLSHNVRDASGFVPFSVDFFTSDGTATVADNDYTAVTGTLNFNGQAGNTQTFTITPMADIVPEGDQTIIVSLQNISNTTWGIDISDTATVTLQEDDTEVALEITKQVSNSAPNVGQTVLFTLQVNNAGPDAAIDAVVQDIVPAGFGSITPVTVPSGTTLTVTGNAIDWSGVDVPASGNAVATFSAVVLAP